MTSPHLSAGSGHKSGNSTPHPLGKKPAHSTNHSPIPMGHMVRPHEQNTITHGPQGHATKQRLAIHSKMRQTQAEESKPAGMKAKGSGAKETPLFKIIPKTCPVNYTYFIKLDGTIEKKLNTSGKDHFYLENDFCKPDDKPGAKNYTLVASLPVNDYGLVNFPAENKKLGFGSYNPGEIGGELSGKDRHGKFREAVGKGDHYLKSDVAAALFGALNDMHKHSINNIDLNDMSADNGSDPVNPGAKHHGGHGHLGKRSGRDIDFRYIGKDGSSYAGVMTSKKFSQTDSSQVYKSAFKYGFDKNNTYRGKSKSIKGVKPMDGHDNHGHLGFPEQPTNITVIP